MQSPVVHILITLLILAVLVFLNIVGVIDPAVDAARRVSGFLSQPIVAVFVPVKKLSKTASAVKSLNEENQNLTKQVAELNARLAVLERAEIENQSLREALGFVDQSDIELLPAQIITLDRLGQNQKAIINRGREQGVKQGDAVVVADNILVGVVSEVLQNTSEIEILTSSEITISAQTSSGEATGVVRGEHGLGLIFDLVSQDELLSVGDLVLTSGLGGQLPKNLFIGEVSEVRSGSSELFQTATVLPAVDLRDLGVVFILR